ncbi:hypothetical protein [Achromobacter deleyi]|uniref:hypothetical protein n=1 Tax=Achromobacter deleyi TaxID=1353891 RepID=UPI001491C8F5|nr:hypothetical protein [Achromobacter deleyi]QVQ29320.1 hypothetical protein HLG70_13365 [Achromobacter deleyi]UIP19441.1 hypothetical protein LYZ39_20975 [Achromobacter deleyi]
MDKGPEVSCGEALTAIAVVGLCIAFALHYPEESADWAAWMQAFGSVAAIAGAGWIARGQVREAQRVEEERRASERKSVAEGRIEQLQAIAVLVEQLFITLDKTATQLNDQISPYDMAAYALNRIAPLKVAITALSGIPVHQLPHAYIGLQILNINNCTAHVVRILEDIQNAPPTMDAEVDTFVLSSASRVVQYRDRASRDLGVIRALTDRYDGVNSPVVLARHPE